MSQKAGNRPDEYPPIRKSGDVCDNEPTAPYDSLMLYGQMFGPVPGTTKHDDDDVATIDLDQRSNGMKILTSSILLAAAALSVTLAGCAGTKNMAAAPEPAPIASPEPAPEPAAVTYVIKDVNFDFDKSTLKPLATDTLDHVAEELNRQPDVRYEVAGFTDSIGSDAYNQGLSERRAAAVRGYLVDHGVSPGQLTTNGYGESNPVASNSTADGRSQNRRVEIRPVK